MTSLDDFRAHCESGQQVFLVLPSPDNKVYTLTGAWDSNLKPVWNVIKYWLPKSKDDKIGYSINTCSTLLEALADISKEFHQFYPRS